MNLTTEQAEQIAYTILQQMGGDGRLHAMVGATVLAFEKDGSLTFRFKSCRKANFVKITLNGLDLYDMTFMKIHSKTYEVKEVKTFENLYSDNLKETFEAFTGLYLSL